MVSLRHVHHSFNKVSSNMSIIKLCSLRLCSCVPVAFPPCTHCQSPPPISVPNVLRHPGCRERLYIQHMAWQKCQLQSQTCPNQFCFWYKLCSRCRVGRREFHKEMATRTAEFYFWSKSLFPPVFVNSLALKRVLGTVWKKLQFFCFKI